MFKTRSNHKKTKISAKNTNFSNCTKMKPKLREKKRTVEMEGKLILTVGNEGLPTKRTAGAPLPLDVSLDSQMEF